MFLNYGHLSSKYLVLDFCCDCLYRCFLWCDCFGVIALVWLILCDCFDYFYLLSFVNVISSGYCFTLSTYWVASCCSVVRAFAYGAIGRRIDS